MSPLEPMNDDNDDDEEIHYDVEKIVDKLVKNDGKVLYSIKWKGFSKTSWEPAENLQCESLLAEFEEEKRMEKSKRSNCLKSMVEKKTQAQIAAEKRRYGQLANSNPEAEEKNERCKRNLVAELTKGNSTTFRIKKIDISNSGGNKPSNSNAAKSQASSSSASVNKLGPTAKENGNGLPSGRNDADSKKLSATTANLSKPSSSSQNVQRIDKISGKTVTGSAFGTAATGASKLLASSANTGQHAGGASGSIVTKAVPLQKSVGSSSLKNSKQPPLSSSKRAASESSSSDSDSSSDSSSSDSSSSSSNSASSPPPAKRKVPKTELDAPTKALQSSSISTTKGASTNPKLSVIAPPDAGATNSRPINFPAAAASCVSGTSRSTNDLSSVTKNNCAKGNTDADRETSALHSEPDAALLYKLSFGKKLANGWDVEKVLGIGVRKQVSDVAVDTTNADSVDNRRKAHKHSDKRTVEPVRIIKLKMRAASGLEHTEYVALDEIRRLPEGSPVLSMVARHIAMNVAI